MKRFKSVLLSLALLFTSAQAFAGYDCFLGEVSYLSFNYAPARNYMPADGRTIAIQGHQTLFALLGNQYGGDGKSTFALPKISPLPTVGPYETPIQAYVCTEGMYPPKY